MGLDREREERERDCAIGVDVGDVGHYPGGNLPDRLHIVDYVGAPRRFRDWGTDMHEDFYEGF